MVEAFTNRDGKGYQTETRCEVGDICECARGSEDMKTPIIKAQVETQGGPPVVGRNVLGQ